MKKYLRLLICIFSPGMIIGLVTVFYTVLSNYVLHGCDPKFGCSGAVMLAVQLNAIVCVLSAIGLVVPCLIFRSTVMGLSRKRLLAFCVLLTACIAGMPSLIEWQSLNSVMSMFFVWSASSAVLGLVLLVLTKYLTLIFPERKKVD